MTAPHGFTCSCGDTDAHVIMRRQTADGVEVRLYDDGAVTGALGVALPGVPLRRPRTLAAVAHGRKAGRLMLGEVCLYDADELPALYSAADVAARGDGLPGTVRRVLRERVARRGLVTLTWTTVSADRDGKPTERVARLPRLRWPGLVVFDFCGGPGSARGRYRLSRTTLAAPNTATDTGFAFRTLAALWAHLKETP